MSYVVERLHDTTLPWGYGILSNNPSMLDVIQANPDKPWNWKQLSHNPSVTWEVIQTNPDKPWNWKPGQVVGVGGHRGVPG